MTVKQSTTTTTNTFCYFCSARAGGVSPPLFLEISIKKRKQQRRACLVSFPHRHYTILLSALLLSFAYDI